MIESGMEVDLYVRDASACGVATIWGPLWSRCAATILFWQVGYEKPVFRRYQVESYNKAKEKRASMVKYGGIMAIGMSMTYWMPNWWILLSRTMAKLPRVGTTCRRWQIAFTLATHMQSSLASGYFMQLAFEILVFLRCSTSNALTLARWHDNHLLFLPLNNCFHIGNLCFSFVLLDAALVANSILNSTISCSRLATSFSVERCCTLPRRPVLRSFWWCDHIDWDNRVQHRNCGGDHFFIITSESVSVLMVLRRRRTAPRSAPIWQFVRRSGSMMFQR